MLRSARTRSPTLLNLPSIKTSSHKKFLNSRFMTSTPPSDEMLDDYHQWKAMGKGGSSHTWAGYLSSLSAEKTMAHKDTLGSGVYHEPEKHATGWPEASETQRLAVQRSYLSSPLPSRAGPRSRAKRYVYPQRERNAAEFIDPQIKEVSLRNDNYRVLDS